eukprot:11167483-Lingulodinium_polyedra.AAC.1
MTTTSHQTWDANKTCKNKHIRILSLPPGLGNVLVQQHREIPNQRKCHLIAPGNGNGPDVNEYTMEDP